MKESHVVRILSVTPVTHDVRSYRVEKPEGYDFVPGQATEVAIKKPGWERELRPFTFTSLTDEPTLEFTIKSYAHQGMTEELGRLQPGDSLILHDVWGAIAYKGPGYFIAGGAGITPFIAILRRLHRDGGLSGNRLFFSNKTSRDIILEDELASMLGDDALFLLTQERLAGDRQYVTGRIDEQFLRERVTDFNRHFYICGPDGMVRAISQTLGKLGASPEAVIFEQ